MTVIFLFASLLFMNWKLTLVMVAILPLIALMVRTASKKFRKQSKKIQLAMGDVTHVASETIQGYRVVRSFGGEAYEEQRFLNASQSNTDKQLRMTRTGAIYTPMLQLVIYTAMAVLMFLVLFLRGDASAGDMVAYITLAGLLPKPIRQLSEVSSTIQKGVAGAESIFEQLDVEPEVDTGTVERDSVSGRLDVRNLSFTYPGTERQVLDDISFSVQPGQMVALVGRSGSGKSTLANLIPRFYHHDKGEILIDDVEIEQYKLLNLRRHIAQVTQHVTLFSDTVANNIAYGDLAGAPAKTSRKPRVMPTRWTSFRNCRKASTLRSARTVYCSPVASASVWQLPARCSERAAADSRRGHLGTRHRIRTAHSGGTGSGDEGAYHPGDRSPSVDHREGRPDSGHGSGGLSSVVPMISCWRKMVTTRASMPWAWMRRPKISPDSRPCPVGASLLAKALQQTTSVSHVHPLSRAGSLPQSFVSRPLPFLTKPE